LLSCRPKRPLDLNQRTSETASGREGGRAFNPDGVPQCVLPTIDPPSGERKARRSEPGPRAPRLSWPRPVTGVHVRIHDRPGGVAAALAWPCLRRCTRPPVLPIRVPRRRRVPRRLSRRDGRDDGTGRGAPCLLRGVLCPRPLSGPGSGRPCRPGGGRARPARSGRDAGRRRRGLAAGAGPCARRSARGGAPPQWGSSGTLQAPPAPVERLVDRALLVGLTGLEVSADGLSVSEVDAAAEVTEGHTSSPRVVARRAGQGGHARVVLSPPDPPRDPTGACRRFRGH
jgi:hypothetical protein